MNSWIHQDSRVSMLYNDVARGIFDNYLGVEGSVPQIINEGETYSQDYSLKLPETIQNKKNIRIVALLLDGMTGEILNAAQCKVDYDPTFISGINSIMIDGQSFDVYSLTGQKIFSKMTSLRGIPSGVYIINHKKVVVK